MLKIKNDVDLNRLKNFGFQLRYNIYTGQPDYYVFILDKTTRESIRIYIKNREIEYDKIIGLYYYEVKKIVEKIIELILEDLIEKIEEKK